VAARVAPALRPVASNSGGRHRTPARAQRKLARDRGVIIEGKAGLTDESERVVSRAAQGRARL